VSIYGEVYRKDSRKRCILSLEWKTKEWWQCGSDVCRMVRRWNTKMWMRLTEKMGEFISKVGCCMLTKTICNFDRWTSGWSGYGDNRWESSIV